MEDERWEVRVLYLCFVLGLGPGVGRGVLTWLMSSILARGARGVLLDIFRTSFTFTRDVRWSLTELRGTNYQPVNVNFTAVLGWAGTVLSGLRSGGEISTVERGEWQLACGLCDPPRTTETVQPLAPALYTMEPSSHVLLCSVHCTRLHCTAVLISLSVVWAGLGNNNNNISPSNVIITILCLSPYRCEGITISHTVFVITNIGKINKWLWSILLIFIFNITSILPQLISDYRKIYKDIAIMNGRLLTDWME